MESRHDPAIIYRGFGGMRGGFPHLSGCVSLGGTVRKTATNAEEALFGPVARMIRIALARAETLVARIDRATRETGMDRSGFLAGSARRMLDARM